MGNDDRQYIQNVARKFMGDLKIRAVDHKGYTNSRNLAKYLYATHELAVARILHTEFKPGTLGEIVYYGQGQMPQGDYASWLIGHKQQSEGRATTMEEVAPNSSSSFQNGAYKLLKDATVVVIAEITTLMWPKIMIGSVTNRWPEEEGVAQEA